MKKASCPRTAMIAPTLILGSCVLFGGRTARDAFVAEARRGDIARAPLVLAETTVKMGAESERIRENAAYILMLILERKRSEEKNPSGELRVKVRLKEDSFVRDFRTLNTVSAEISLFEGDSPNPVALFVESEDTEETLSSYAYLHSLLEKTVGRIE